MVRGSLKGISILESNNDICLQLFTDDTNALLHNDDQSIDAFWNHLNTFCLASGSRVNHNKINNKTMVRKPPP